MSKKLDVDIIKRLYDFGGLQAYKVSVFDPIEFKIVTHLFTFNTDYASKTFENIKAQGHFAKIEQFIVKFDGAFSKETTGE